MSANSRSLTLPLPTACRLEQLAKEFPANGFYPLMQTAALSDWGAMENRWGKHGQALKHLDQALPLLDAIRANEKNPQYLASARRFTRINQNSRGLALRQLKRYPEAAAAYGKALALADERDRPMLRLNRALALAHSGEHAQAVAEADAVAGKTAAPGMLYDAACVLSLASVAAGADCAAGRGGARQAHRAARRAHRRPVAAGAAGRAVQDRRPGQSLEARQ